MEHERDLNHLSARRVKFLRFTYILAQQWTNLNESPNSVTSPHSVCGPKIVEIMGVFAPHRSPGSLASRLLYPWNIKAIEGAFDENFTGNHV